MMLSIGTASFKYERVNFDTIEQALHVLSLAFFLPLFAPKLLAQTPTREVVVNEIQYDPADDGSEFVELQNRSEHSVTLRTLQIADARQEPVLVSKDPLTLPAGGFLVVARDSVALHRRFPNGTAIEPSSWPSLNNNGDAVIFTSDGALLDSVRFTPKWGGGSGLSLERIDPFGPSQAFNFGSSEAARGATPGAPNSIFARDDAPPRPVFAEQRDASTLQVTFDEPLDPASVEPPDFQLRGTTPTSVKPSGSQALLHFTTPISATTLVILNVRDLTGNTLNRAQTKVVFRPSADDLAINEIMYSPRHADDDGLPNQPEFVELVNRTNRLLTLSRMYLTDAPDEHGEADTTRPTPDRFALYPGGYAIVFATKNTDLENSFPNVNFDGASNTLLPVRSSSLGLSNQGDVVVLHRRDGTVLDSVTYDPTWHRPDLTETRGVSLERIRARGPSSAASNWTSSVAPGGATPGQANAVASSPNTNTDAANGLHIHPSPFSPDGDGFEDTAIIQYTLQRRASSIRVRIYDQSGRLVRTLRRASLTGRKGAVNWDGRSDEDKELRLGIYVVVLDAVVASDGHSATYKEPVVLARSLN